MTPTTSKPKKTVKKQTAKSESISMSARREIRGVVVKRSGDKTVAVEVVRTLRHPLYEKQLKRTKKYLAHDAQNVLEVGQAVWLVESRPLSARKRFVARALDLDKKAA